MRRLPALGGRIRPLPLPPLRIRALHLAALAGYAFAQPVFDLLTREPNTLITSGARPADVVALALIATVAIPAGLVGLTWIAGRVHPSLGAELHLLLLAGLVYLVLVRLAWRWPNGALLALLLTAAVLLVYGRSRAARSFVTVSALAPVAFTILFLVNGPAAALGQGSDGERRLVASRNPVVLVVLDEFPLASLLGGDLRIEAARYPNFDRLAREATWFRGATTVHEYTPWAVPAILTGRRPRTKLLPIARDHPESLFRLLGGTYDVNAYEVVTKVCPRDICPIPSEGAVKRLSRIVADSASLYRRRSFGTPLPGDILVWNEARRDPRAEVASFLATLGRSSSQPELHVLHVLLPHFPWRFDSAGVEHEAHIPEEGIVGDGWPDENSVGDRWNTWGDDAPAVERSYRRHLEQVAYTDRVLGRIVRRLRQVGLYDRSLLVVTADHGASFVPGQTLRTVSPRNIHDIAPVPLFVKTPFQRAGVIDDRAASTIDIVPTIAQVLGIEPFPDVDGISLLARPRDDTRVSVMNRSGDVVTATRAAVLRGLRASVRRKERLLAKSADSASLWVS